MSSLKAICIKGLLAILIALLPAVACIAHKGGNEWNTSTGEINLPATAKAGGEDSLKHEYSLRTSLTGSQASFKNWSQAGVDNVAMLSGLKGRKGYTGKISRQVLSILDKGQYFTSGAFGSAIYPYIVPDPVVQIKTDYLSRSEEESGDLPGTDAHVIKSIITSKIGDGS